MKKQLKTTLQLLATTGLIFYIYYKLDISFSKLSVVPVSYFWIMAAVLCRVICMPILAITRWKIFLNYVGVHEKFFQLMKINYVSAFWGLIVPSSSGYDVFRLYYIERKHPEARGKVGSTVIAERLIGFLLLTLLGLTGSFLVNDYAQILNIRIFLICTLLFLFAILFVATHSVFYNILEKLLNRISFGKKIFEYIKKVHFSLVNMPLMQILPRVLPIMILFQLSTIILAFFLFKGFGVHLPFYTHLALLSVIYVITVIPVSISGFGLREGAFVFFYSSLGVSPTISFSVSILYYIISMGFPTLLGAFIFLYQKKDFARPETY